MKATFICKKHGKDLKPRSCLTCAILANEKQGGSHHEAKRRPSGHCEPAVVLSL